MEKIIGHWSFVIGVIIALVLGIASQWLPADVVPWLTSLIVVLGLAVGFLNVAGKETKEFLLVATVLIIAVGLGGANAALTGVKYVGPYLNAILNQLLAFIVPATIVVGLKDILALAKFE